MASYRLTYFDIPARAEPIRLAFAIGNIAFEDQRVGFAGFQELKASGALPHGTVPLLQVGEGEDSLVLNQSEAMLRFVGRLAGLYPVDDAARCARIDDACGLIEDGVVRVFAAIMPQSFGFPAFADDAAKRVVRSELATKILPQQFARLETMIKNSGAGWLVGAECSIADLKLYAHLKRIQSNALDGIPGSLVDDSELLSAHIARVEAVPEVQRWYNTADE